MALRREMHDDVGLVALERVAHGAGVADVDFREGVTRMRGDRGEVVEIAGVGQGIEVHDLVVRVGDQVAHHRGSDEAGAAGDEETERHGQALKVKGVAASRRNGSTASFSETMIAATGTGQVIAMSGSSQRMPPSAGLL